MNQHPGMLCDCHHVYQADIKTSLMHSCKIKSYHNSSVWIQEDKKDLRKMKRTSPASHAAAKSSTLCPRWIVKSCVHAESCFSSHTSVPAFHRGMHDGRSETSSTGHPSLEVSRGNFLFGGQHVFGPTDFPGFQWQVHDHSGSMMQSRHVSDDLTAVCLKVGQF